MAEDKVISLPITEIEARIAVLEKDMLLTEKQIEEGTLIRSSLSGGIIELKKILEKKK